MKPEGPNPEYHVVQVVHLKYKMYNDYLFPFKTIPLFLIKSETSDLSHTKKLPSPRNFSSLVNYSNVPQPTARTIDPSHPRKPPTR